MYKRLSKSAVLKYFTTESQEKPKAIFEKVHFPMDRIRVELCREGKHGEFAHERDIARWVLDVDGGAPNNRIFSVVGETGSGKSELCQYLQYAAENSPHHIPILISRSTTKLAQIVRLLNEHAGLSDDDGITEVTDLQAVHIVTLSVAYVMRVTLTQQFKSRYTESQLRELERLFERDAFKALLARSFQEYRAQVNELGKERELNLLNRKEFDLLFANAAPWLHLDSAYVACRDLIHESIKEQVKVGDMSGRLRRISDRCRAMRKRPLLILEDLTSFGFMKEELLDYLFQLNSGNFDVVIGWTNGFEAENLGSIFRTQGDAFTYMKERLRGRFAMTDAQRTSWFLEQHHARMMARYIEAARSESGLGLPVEDLYPVSPAFVSHLYDRLIDDNKQPKRTPRLLLTAMQAVLSRPDEPWLNAAGLVGQMVEARALPGRLFELAEEYPEEVRFLEWYGRLSDGKVSRSLAQKLGVTLPPALAGYLTDDEPERVGTGVQQHEGKQEQEDDLVGRGGVPDESTGEREAGGQRDKSGKQVDGSTRTPDPEPTPKKPVDPLEKERRDIQQWLDGQEFNLRRTAEKGLELLLRQYGDQAGISNPAWQQPVVLRYEKTKVHAFFDGTADRPESFPVVFVPRDRRAHEHVLTALTVGKADRATVAEAALLKDSALVHWVGQLYDAYREEQESHLQKRLGMSVERFVYHLYVTIVGLATGETGEDLQSLVRFDPKSPERPAALELSCLKAAPEVDELLKYRRTITNLFRSFFFLNPTTLDLPRVLKVREGYTHAAFGQAIRTLDRENIDQGFWLVVDSAERARGDKVLLSHLFTQCVSLDGRLKAARQEFTADRERMQEAELRKLVAGLSDAELRTALRGVERLLSATQRARPKDWNDLTALEPYDFASAADQLEAAATRAACATDVFAMAAAHREHRAVSGLREVKALRMLVEILTQAEEDVRRMETDLNDKQFYARADKSEENCRVSFNRISDVTKEVGA